MRSERNFFFFFLLFLVQEHKSDKGQGVPSVCVWNGSCGPLCNMYRIFHVCQTPVSCFSWTHSNICNCCNWPDTHSVCFLYHRSSPTSYRLSRCNRGVKYSYFITLTFFPSITFHRYSSSGEKEVVIRRLNKTNLSESGTVHRSGCTVPWGFLPVRPYDSRNRTTVSSHPGPRGSKGVLVRLWVVRVQSTCPSSLITPRLVLKLVH